VIGLAGPAQVLSAPLEFFDADELREHAWQLPREVRDNAGALPQWLQEAMRREPTPAAGHQPNEWTSVRADGTRFPALLALSVLRNAPGQAIGFLGVVTDLTPIKAMEEELRRRSAQAEAASQGKTAFLANMSHEFRTPLNAVMGLSQLLAQMDLPGKARQFVMHIAQAGEQLLALTDDVLDLSRIEAGEMRLEHRPFALRELLDTVRALVQPQADAKGLALRVESREPLPGMLAGDALRLKQVLLNLLGNAVKFTPAGSVTLCVRELAHEAACSTLRFEVIDTGIGIAPEQQERIFEAFKPTLPPPGASAAWGWACVPRVNQGESRIDSTVLLPELTRCLT
jgi:signal transduction histidine kinase